MEVTQYERDIARIEAHKLALMDDEFHRLVEHVQSEVSAHARYLREQHSAPITLRDHDSRRATVENADGLRFAVFTYNYVRHEVEVVGVGVRYLFSAAVDGYGKAIVTWRSFGQAQGTASQHQITKAVRNAIESITDTPRPVA